MDTHIGGNLSRKSSSADLKDPSYVHAEPIGEHGSWEIDDHPGFWDTYVKEAAAYDRRMIDGWFKMLDNMLIYAGLFSAASASFISYTQGGLESDPAETMVDLLRLILVHRNDNEEFTPEQLGLAPFVATTFDRAINSVMYTSLSCSLLVALGAAIGKDWLNHYDYSVTGVATAHFLSGPVRQRKLNGLKLWQFALLIQLLPIILQLSLVLFFIATIQHLWQYSVQVAMVNLVLLVIGVVFYMWTIITTMMDHDSPYHSPMSRILRAILHTILLLPASSSQADLKRMYHRSLGLIASLKVSAMWKKSPRPLLPSSWAAVKRAYHRGLRLVMSLMNGSKKPHSSTPSYDRWWSRLSSMANHNRTRTKEEKRVMEEKQAMIRAYALLEKTREHRESACGRDRTRADCWAWLTVQASDPMVIVQVRQATTLIPPAIALEIVQRQPTVLSQVIKAYNEHIAIRTGHDRRAAHPADAIFTGASLFHILKTWQPADDSIANEVRNIRVLQPNDMDHPDVKTNRQFWLTVTLVACCVEMVRDVPRNQLKKLVKLGREVQGVKKLLVPRSSFRFLPPMEQKDGSSTFSVSPSRLWLDAIIYFAIHSIFDSVINPEDKYLAGADDARDEMDDILDIIKCMLFDAEKSLFEKEKSLLDETKLNEEYVSHISIAVAAIQLRAAVLKPTNGCQHHVGRKHDEGVQSILAAWGVVDKRKTVFSNIILAFQWGAHCKLHSDNSSKDATLAIYTELLRLSPHYVPAGLRLSWRARDKWHRHWPEVMKMFPAILHFIHHVHVHRNRDQRKQILHLFMKLLPEDWAGRGIHAALKHYPTKLYPQIHALSPSEATYAEELRELLKSFLHEWEPGQSTDDLTLSNGIEDEVTISNTKESVVRILSWMGAYHQRELPQIVDRRDGLFQQSASVPSLLLSVIATTQSPEVCNSAVSFLGKLLRLPAKPGDARFTIQLDAAIRIFSHPKMIHERLDRAYFRSFVFTMIIQFNGWLPLALKMRQPSLASSWPVPSVKSWFDEDADLLKIPEKDDIAAWCWRGLIWTWLLAKNHLSLLGMIESGGQVESAQTEVQEAIEHGNLTWDSLAGNHSGVDHHTDEDAGEADKNNHRDKTIVESKGENQPTELEIAKRGGEMIKKLLFSENVVESVTNFIMKTGLEKIVEHDHLMGRYWIPIAEDYLNHASKAHQSHPISVVSGLLSKHRSNYTV